MLHHRPLLHLHIVVLNCNYAGYACHTAPIHWLINRYLYPSLVFCKLLYIWLHLILPNYSHSHNLVFYGKLPSSFTAPPAPHSTSPWGMTAPILVLPNPISPYFLSCRATFFHMTLAGNSQSLFSFCSIAALNSCY